MIEGKSLKTVLNEVSFDFSRAVKFGSIALSGAVIREVGKILEEQSKLPKFLSKTVKYSGGTIAVGSGAVATLHVIGTINGLSDLRTIGVDSLNQALKEEEQSHLNYMMQDMQS